MKMKQGIRPKAKILIVDDTPEYLEMLSQILKHYGYEVRAVLDGSAALSLARGHPPDLIMLDISMPMIDGIETCRLLKSDDRTCSIPVIFISAMQDTEEKVKAFQAGGVDYVLKPFQIEEVLARIEIHLSIRQLQTELEAANRELAKRLQELVETQAAEREQRILAETLRDTSEAINSSLDYEEVLDLILENLAKVVPHDAANIALLDAQNTVHFKRGRGYQEYDLHEYILSFETPLESFPTWRKAYHSRQPQIIPDTRECPDWIMNDKIAWIRSYACAPIVVKSQVIGFLNLDSATAGFFEPKHADRLKAFATQAAIAIENANLFRETQRLAITDDLTGVFNRRYLLELARKELERARRYQHPLSLILFDLDHFKQINDRFGHPMGDITLQKIAHLCRLTIRATDIFGRYGGEEFLIITPETGFQEAMEVAERFRKQVEKFAIETERGTIRLTISLGIATLKAGTQMSLEELITKTDDALYAAKAQGRNRVSGFCE